MHITEKEEEESFYLLPLSTRGGRGEGGLLRPPKNQQQPFKGRGGASALFSQKKSLVVFHPSFRRNASGVYPDTCFPYDPLFKKNLPSLNWMMRDGSSHYLPFPPFLLFFPGGFFFRSAAAGDRDGKRGEAKFNFVGGRKADEKDTTAELF